MSTGLAFRTFTIRWVVLLGLASLSVNALTVTHPFANTNIVAGEDTLVSWSDVNAGTTSVNIYLSKASGTSTTLISSTLATNVNATKGSSTVKVPTSVASGSYYIFVRSANDITVGDTVGPITLASSVVVAPTPTPTASKASSAVVVTPTKSLTASGVLPSLQSSAPISVSSASPLSSAAPSSASSRPVSSLISAASASSRASSATRTSAQPTSSSTGSPAVTGGGGGLSSGQIGGIAGGAAGGVIVILGAILLVRRSKRKNEPERNIQRASNLFKDPSGHHGTGGFDETDNIKDAQHLHHQSQIQNQSGGYTDYRQPQYPAYAEPNNNYADYGYGGDNGGGYYPPSVPIGRFENSGYHRQSNVVSPSPGPGQNQGQNRGIPYSPPMQTMPAPMQEYSSSRYQYTPQLQFQPQWQEQQNYYDYPNDPTGGMNEMPPSHNQQGFYYPQYDQYDPYLQQQQQQQPPLPQHSVVNQPMAMPGYAPQQQQYPIDSRSPEPIIVSQSPPPPGANSNISDARQSRMSSDQRNSFDQRNSSEQRTSMPEDQRRVMSPTRAAQDSSKLVV